MEVVNRRGIMAGYAPRASEKIGFSAFHHESRVIRQELEEPQLPVERKLRVEVHFSALEEAIEASRYILDLPDDWDGEGSPGYTSVVWMHATDLVRTIGRRLFQRTESEPLVPAISNGPDGSIDLHWEHPSFELLINVPANPLHPPRYYGDDYGVDQFKGRLISPRKLTLLIDWLAAHQ